MSTRNRRSVRLLSILFLGIALLLPTISARKFHSRDIHVSAVITECEEKITGPPYPTGYTLCQARLGCILRTVGAYTSARWSAGASILAFIPTITAVMSNGIEEIVQIAEEDTLLAVMLSLCSVTVFAVRFVGGRELDVRTVDAIFDHSKAKAARAKNASPHRTRRIVLCISYAVLLSACGSVWFPAVVILRNGVVVFCCPTTIHIPLWIASTQAIVMANVFLRRFCFERIAVSYQPTSIGVPTQLSTASSTPVVILRVPKLGFLSRFIKGYTSVITFGLYAFATAVFGAMTMFTASDACWCLVLFAFAAGVGRIVASFVVEDYVCCRRTIVVDVQKRQVQELQARIEATILLP